MADAGADSADDMLSRAHQLLPPALAAARSAAGFPGRWKAIAGKLERVAPCLADLSSHPCFAKNALCRELLQSVLCALAEAVDLAGSGGGLGKLQMQSDLDALTCKLELTLRDCALLVKTGVLADASPAPAAAASLAPDVHELLARLQIGHVESKHRAVDGLLDMIREDDKSVLPVLGRSNVAALVQLLTATAPKIREKTATVISLIAESGSFDAALVSEGALPPLIRLAESGSISAREKAAITLQRLSMSADTARCIAGHGGIQPLIELCRTGDSISQSAAAGTLKNLSAVPELRLALAEEGIVRVMLALLEGGAAVVLVCKEYAAECLQNVTTSNDALRRAVVAEGGVRSLLTYLDRPFPQEPAAAALRNLVETVSPDSLVALGVFPVLAHVLKNGSPGAQQAACVAICKISISPEMKRLVGDLGFAPLLVQVLEAKSNGAREAAAQAVAALMNCAQSAREVKREDKCVPNLVRLLDPAPGNTAKKYAIACLLSLAPCRRCRRLMVAHGAIGYLKKLAETDVTGARKLLDKLERRKLRALFGRN